MNGQNYFKGRLRAIGYVFTGMGKVLRREHSIWAQWVLFLVNLGVAYFLSFEVWEWAMTVAGWGMIFAMETMNTAVEKLADVVSPGYNKDIGDVKDLAAGAVGWAAGVVLVLFLIFVYRHL